LTLLDQMIEALRECSDDLEAEIRYRYGGSGRLLYPSEQIKFDRDMLPVKRARALLEVITEDTQH